MAAIKNGAARDMFFLKGSLYRLPESPFLGKWEMKWLGSVSRPWTECNSGLCSEPRPSLVERSQSIIGQDVTRVLALSPIPSSAQRREARSRGREDAEAAKRGEEKNGFSAKRRKAMFPREARRNKNFLFIFRRASRPLRPLVLCCVHFLLRLKKIPRIFFKFPQPLR